jgi:hypothetical protein
LGLIDAKVQQSHNRLTRGAPFGCSASAVTAHTSASSLSGDRPPERAYPRSVGPKSHNLSRAAYASERKALSLSNQTSTSRERGRNNPALCKTDFRDDLKQVEALETRTAADAGTSRGGQSRQQSKPEPLARSYPRQRRRSSISEQLRELAFKAVRLSPAHGDPERFYIAREEVVRGLLRLARETVA